MFHRLRQPTYFSAPALPAGPSSITFNGVQYNLINVISDGAGLPFDGSASADGAKAAGPNQGTYLVAHGEDAKSSNANRGLKALAENTDVLDDWFHRDIALPVRTSVATAGAPVSSIVLPASTFVGTTGSMPLAFLFSVLGPDDSEILIDTTKVTVTSITGATIGSGFSAGLVTLNLSIPLPAGRQYRVYYSTRSNLSVLPADALLTPKPMSDEVSTLVQSVIQAIKGENLAGDKGEPSPLNTLWDDYPYFTLRGLGHNGLDGLYRRRTVLDPVNDNNGLWLDDINQAGAGAAVRVDGPAILAFTQGNGPGEHQDPTQAMFWAKDGTYLPGATPRIPFVGTTHINYSAAGMAYNLVGDGAGSATRTTLNLAAGGADNSNKAELKTLGTHFFELKLVGEFITSHFSGVDGTRILAGQDILVLQVDFAAETGLNFPGSVNVPFRVVGVRSPTTVTLATLDGSPLPFLATNATLTALPVIVAYWLRHAAAFSSSWLWTARNRYPAFITEYNALVAGGMSPVTWGGTSLSVVAQTAVVAPDLPALPTASIYARNFDAAVALAWGFVQDTDGTLVTRATLHKDGSIESMGSATFDESVTVGSVLYASAIESPISLLIDTPDMGFTGNRVNAPSALVRMKREKYAPASIGAVKANIQGNTALTNLRVLVPASTGYRTVHIQWQAAAARTANVSLSLECTGEYELGERVNFFLVEDNPDGATHANYNISIFNTPSPFNTISDLVGTMAAEATVSTRRAFMFELVCVGYRDSDLAPLFAVAAPPINVPRYAWKQRAFSTLALNFTTSANGTYTLT